MKKRLDITEDPIFFVNSNSNPVTINTNDVDLTDIHSICIKQFYYQTSEGDGIPRYIGLKMGNYSEGMFDSDGVQTQLIALFVRNDFIPEQPVSSFNFTEGITIPVQSYDEFNNIKSIEFTFLDIDNNLPILFTNLYTFVIEFNVT